MWFHRLACRVFCPPHCCMLPPPSLPRTQDKVDMAMHWQANVERRNQTKLFCATFSSFTQCHQCGNLETGFSCVAVTPRTETTVNIWHNWVWTVSSGHERVACGLDGERHRGGGQWDSIEGLPSGAMLAALRRLRLPTPLPGPTSPLPTASPERERA